MIKNRHINRLYSVDGRRWTPACPYRQVGRVDGGLGWIICFIILIFFPIYSFGQIVVSAELDSTSMLIGDQMKLHLLVNHAEGVGVENPELATLEKAGVEVLNVSDWDTLKTGAEHVLQKDITFTAWDSGYVFIPKIPIPYAHNGETGVASTNEIPLMVNTPPLDTLLAPIKPIIREPRTFEDFIPAIATILGLFIMAAVIYYFWKRKDRREMPLPPEIRLPAHEIALAKLEELKQKKLWQKGDVKAYQSELTHIVREYLENRFGVHALESTTDEILRQLKKTDLPDEWEGKLREMLQMADLVKFAKAHPAAEFHDRMMDYAEDFVFKTKKTEIPAEEETEEENV